MNYKEALELWGAITDYIDVWGNLQGEGNSGEFHNEKEEKKIRKQEEEFRRNLQKTFLKVTGFWPVWHRVEERWTKMIDEDLQ